MNEAKSTVQAFDLMAQATGRQISASLGKDPSKKDLEQALVELPTDWHVQKALLGINSHRADQGWEPLTV